MPAKAAEPFYHLQLESRDLAKVTQPHATNGKFFAE
jgi:hypothetical protein